MVLRGRQQGISLGFNVTCDSEGWAGLAEQMESLKGELKSAADLPALARALLPLVSHLELRTPSAAAHRDALAVARTTLRTLHAHRQVEQAIGHDHAEAATLLLLSISDLLPSARRAEVDVLSPDVPEHVLLASEVSNVRAQLGALWTHARQKVESGRES